MHLSLSETSAKNWSFHHGHSLAGRNLESGTMAPRPHTATLSDQAILARWLCLQRVTFTFRKMSKPIASNSYYLFQYVSICFNMFQYVSICFNISTSLYHVYIYLLKLSPAITVRQDQLMWLSLWNCIRVITFHSSWICFKAIYL